MTARTPPLAVLALFALTACGPTKSIYLDTAGIHPEYSLVKDGASPLRAVALFRAYDAEGDLLTLVDGDEIAIDGEKVEPTSGDRYERLVPDAPSHSFTFSRADEQPVTHTIETSPPFKPEVSPPSAASLAPLLVWERDDGSTFNVSATWANTNQSTCPSLPPVENRNDLGSLRLDFANLAPDLRDAQCTYTLQFTRSETASIGAPFGGGSLHTESTAKLVLQVQFP